jgi:hypothetical protein
MYKFWSFIADNVISLVTVAVGLVVLIVQGINQNVSSNLVAGTTLALVTLLATSEIVERQRRLSRIENLVEQDAKQYQVNMDQIVEKLGEGLDNTVFRQVSPNEAFEYMRYKFATAKRTILWVGVGSRKSTASGTKRAYEDVFEKVAGEGKVQIRWITTLDVKARVERASRLVFGKAKSPNVFVGYFPHSTDLPLFGFVIVDNDDLLIRPPIEEGGRVDYTIVSSRVVSQVFLHYFDALWSKSLKLDRTENTRRLLEETLENLTPGSSHSTAESS